jgi:hypothetical protein
MHASGVSIQRASTRLDGAGSARTRRRLTDERQRKLADAVGKQARAELRKARKPKDAAAESGTKVARWRKPAS